MMNRGLTISATTILAILTLILSLRASAADASNCELAPRARGAVGVDSGAAFYSNCWNYWAGQDEDSFGDAHKTGFCKGYVKAVTNALLARRREPVVCLPKENVQMDEVHQILRQYFENNSKLLREDVDVLIETALRTAYPCNESR